MNILKNLFLIIIGSLLMNTNYAQCPIGETEITIQFIQEGRWPSEIQWDYKIGGIISGSGPYTTANVITTCVPEGDVTIVGCDTATDTWNNAIFELRITEDGSVNNCTSQNGCKLYTSTNEDTQSINSCSENLDFEVANIVIGACGETEVITTGCTNAEAINYDACAVTDDGTCMVPAENNSCENAILIDVLDSDCTEYIYEYFNPFGDIDIFKECNNFLGIDNIYHDGFYKIAVPSSGQFRFSPDFYDALALYKNCNAEPLFCGNVNHFTNLTPGDTLILQISNISYQEGKIEFCLQATEPTTNSNCVDADIIKVQNNKVCIDENFTSLIEFNNNQLNIIPICNEDALYDAFYQFIAPSSGSIKINNYGSFGLALYNSCEVEPIFCESEAAQQVITNLVAGDTLLLQIYNSNDDTDVSFCIEEAFPPSNNNCNQPTFISVLEENEINQSHVYNDLDINATCFENVSADSFFSFIVPNSGQVKFNHNFWGSNLQVALYSNCTAEATICGSAYNDFLFRNLVPGDTLLLQVASQYFSEGIRFTLSDAPPTENNDCSNAKFIDVSTIDKYLLDSQMLFLNYNTASNQPECDDFNTDAYYQFVVPPSGDVSFSSGDYLGVSVYESCEESPVYCEIRGYGDKEINDLTPGDTLILQVYMFNVYDIVNFYLEEIGKSLNNTCADAIPVNVAASGECNKYEVDLTLKYNTPNEILACNNNANPDAFYEIIVPPSGLINIKHSKEIGIVLYTACGGNEIYCNQDYYNEIITDLTPGETLILQFFELYNSGAFNFCIEEIAPSLNNNCSNATSITVAENGNCQMHEVSLNNLNYNSLNIYPSCDSRVLFDAFYEFVVPESGQITFEASDQVGIAIYQACNSNSLFCEEYTQSEIIRNLPIGETVILQIFEYYSQADFTFCLEEVIPSINNLCINAEPFIVNEPGACEGNFIRVTNSLNNTDVNPYCASYVMADAFYSFIVPASGHISISTSEQTQTGIAIYDDCLEQSFYCNDGFTNQVITNLNPNDTLILQVFQTAPFNFDLCLEDAPPSVNNNCADAISIQIYKEGECEGNFVTAPIKNNSVNINPSCMYINADIFYRVTVPENGQFRVITDTYNIGLSVYTACDTNSLICKNSLRESLIQDLPAKEEVFLQFFQGDNPFDFEFCIETAIQTVNNNCSNATLLNVSSPYDIFEQINTINMNNNTIDISPSCNSIDNDAFYSFTVPQNGKIVFYAINDFGMALYNNCNSESIFCDSYINDQIIISDLPAGEELILQIFDRYDYSDIKFSISEVEDNISCESATLICEPSVKSSNFGGTESLYMDGSECISNYSSINNVVWYSFTTDSSSVPVSIEIIKNECTYQYDDLYAQVLSNACSGEYVEEACLEIDGNKETMTLDNPLPNQQYYLRIGNDSSYENCTFEINIAEGIEYNCCQLDYSLSTWCYHLNTNNYFVDVNVNDLGQNPSGYQVMGTNKRIIETGTTIIGPIANGTTTLTLQGLDKADCSITKTINFNCAQCEEHLVHDNISHSRSFNFNAAKTIESGMQVMPSVTVNYLAADSIMLKQGFTVEKGAGFSIDIEDCE